MTLLLAVDSERYSRKSAAAAAVVDLAVAVVAMPVL
jgi:hypothetical protein